MATTKLMTAEDLEEMPSDAYRYDLIRGELRRMSPAGYEHGKLITQVYLPLGTFVAANDLGDVLAAETGFILERDPDTMLAPDVAFVARERVPPAAVPDRFAAFSPDLAVETVSPGDRLGEIAEKAAIYLGAGVRLLWILYPARRAVRVHRPNRPMIDLTENDVLDGEDVLPGFRLPIRDIFR